MNEKEQHQQIFQAQLDEWKEDISKLKVMAKGAHADIKIEMHKHVKELEQRIHEAGTKLLQLTKASETTWAFAKKDVEEGWDSLKTAISDTVAQYTKLDK